MAGEDRSQLLGNTGFLKIDFSLTPHQYLSARLNTSRYYGQNNVFFDPASPVTSFAISENGEEDVSTESGSVSLTSALLWRLTSHLRAQFSRDLQESSSNTSDALTRITHIIDGFGRSTILPRRTREHRLHLAETLSLDGSRHSWKFGGDALLTKVYNFFPSVFGGEYIFSDIRVNPFYLRADARWYGDHTFAVLCAWCAPVLHPEFWLCSFASRYQRILVVCTGYDSHDQPAGAELGTPV